MAHHPRPLKLTGSRCFLPYVSGFTLIEALIALFVLGFGLAAVARLQADLFIEGRQTKSLAEATALARSQLEALRFQVSLDSPGLKAVSGQRKHIGVHETYSIRWQSHPAPGDVFSQAQAQVLWTDRSGPQTVKLATLIADPEPLAAGQLFLITPPPGP